MTIIKNIEVCQTVYWSEQSELFEDECIDYRATCPQSVERDFGSNWEYDYNKKVPMEVVEVFNQWRP